jgi:hypothetical protein
VYLEKITDLLEVTDKLYHSQECTMAIFLYTEDPSNRLARGKGLGFTIVGGSDSEKGNLGIFVRRILPRGLVAEEGSMKEGKLLALQYSNY